MSSNIFDGIKLSKRSQTRKIQISKMSDIDLLDRLHDAVSDRYIISKTRSEFLDIHPAERGLVTYYKTTLKDVQRRLGELQGT